MGPDPSRTMSRPGGRGVTAVPMADPAQRFDELPIRRAPALSGATSLARGLFTEIAKALRENVGVDLGACRHDLALLALGRRLRARRQESLKSYAALISEDPVEPRRLARALLPGDGDLFLDGDAAAVLSLRLAATITQRGTPQLWVVECGEGEEVYALALRLHDQLAALEGAVEFTIHGSEIDAGALQLARSGMLTPGFVEQIPAALKRHFLQALAHGAQVAPELQRFCLFHEQLLMAAPPVPVVDVISGRNILRFLSQDECRQLLLHWHHALKPGGLLLLGPGESVEGHEDLFAPRPLAPGVYLRQGLREGASALVTPTVDRAEVDVSAYRGAFSSSLRPSAILDAEGRLLDVNNAFAQLLAHPTEALRGRRFQEFCASANHAVVDAALMPSATGDAAGKLTLAITVLRGEGSVPMLLHLNLHAGQAIRCHAELEPQGLPVAGDPESSAGLQAVLEAMSEGLILVDGDGRVQTINQVARKLTGYSQREAFGRPLSEVFALYSPLGERLGNPAEDCQRSGQTVRVSGAQAQLMARDGRRVAVDVRALPAPSVSGGAGVAVLFEDVSQRLLLTEELAWRTSHDVITGLLNRDEFDLRVRAALTGARGSEETSVLCMIDIDQFRLVNDVLGHAAGDELLHELAGEMRVRLRERDILARLSGDEFGVLLQGCTLAEAEPLVNKLLDAARRYRFQWMDRKYSVTFSIGVAQVDASTESVGHVLSLADAACHAAKQAGRDRASFMGIDHAAGLLHSEMGVVGEVGQAIEDGRLFLIGEDVVRVDAPDQVVYRELLVRMRGEDGSLIRPASFVPAAERYFLMGTLDRWVVREAMSKLGRLRPEQHRGILYAINVSGQSIGDPEFLGFVLQEIQRSGVDPERLCFELTETAAISRLTDAARFVGGLSERGCKFALDDFGVGMSSFGYLKNFPVHFLKIDGSFVRSMRDSQIDRGMVETINRIGHQLGLKTIAEHVESLDLFEPLKSMGVDWAQGHGIATARSLDDILK